MAEKPIQCSFGPPELNRVSFNTRGTFIWHYAVMVREMEFGSLDGGEDGEHGVGFMEITKIFMSHEAFFFRIMSFDRLKSLTVLMVVHVSYRKIISWAETLRCMFEKAAGNRSIIDSPGNGK